MAFADMYLLFFPLQCPCSVLVCFGPQLVKCMPDQLALAFCENDVIDFDSLVCVARTPWAMDFTICSSVAVVHCPPSPSSYLHAPRHIVICLLCGVFVLVFVQCQQSNLCSRLSCPVLFKSHLQIKFLSFFLSLHEQILYLTCIWQPVNLFDDNSVIIYCWKKPKECGETESQIYFIIYITLQNRNNQICEMISKNNPIGKVLEHSNAGLLCMALFPPTEKQKQKFENTQSVSNFGEFF